MKRFLHYIMLIALMTVICSCSEDLDEGGTNGSISGSVSDATTGEPVATVNVTLLPGGQSTVTGSDGSFSFQNLESGEYTLEISKEGYKPNSTNINVRYGDSTPAHLLIERIPAIVTADRLTLDFGDNPSLNTLSFNIVNSSYEDLAWEIEHRCDWITEVKPAKGVLPYGKTEGIVVVIDRSKLNAGENKAVIVVRSSNGSSEMNVIAIGEETTMPTLNTLAATKISSSTATFNGEIITKGVPPYDERGFVYSTSSMPTLENTIARLTSTITSSKQFSFNAKELTHSTTYYVRAYAKNGRGVAYSTNEIKFNTSIPLPEVKTLGVVNVDFSGGTATFRGEITFAGIPAYTERGFVYGTLPEPTVNDNKIIANGAGETGTFSNYVTGLPKNTYYMRAYAVAKSGTVYGEEKIIISEWIEIPSAGIAVQKEDLGKVNWNTADAMCKNSTLGGYTDWRLPTKEELMVLYNNRNQIGGFQQDRYWSSSVDVDYRWYIDFWNGFLNSSTTSQENYVRAVRSINK